MTTIYKYIKNSACIAIVMLLISCDKSEQSSSQEHHEEREEVIELTQAQYDQGEIQIGSPEIRQIGSELYVNGIIDVPPSNKVSINMPYGGFVKRIEMLPGTSLKKSQVLAVIENPDFIQFQQDYLENIANQEYLKNEYERQLKLYNENVSSGKSFQQAKSAYQSNEVSIKALEERLKLIGFNTAKIREGNISGSVTLYSPVSGTVHDVYANVGKYINPQDVILDITNAEDLHVELTVYETDIPRISVGQRIRFSLANAPDVWREAEIFLIGSGVREDRSVTVHGHLKNKTNDLYPGMYVAAKIETGRKETWTVPEEAIVRFSGKYYVFEYRGKKQEDDISMHDFEMIEIKKGITEDEFTEISLLDSSRNLSELKLAIEGAFTLLAKAKNTEEEGGHHH